MFFVYFLVGSLVPLVAFAQEYNGVKAGDLSGPQGLKGQVFLVNATHIQVVGLSLQPVGGGFHTETRELPGQPDLQFQFATDSDVKQATDWYLEAKAANGEAFLEPKLVLLSKTIIYQVRQPGRRPAKRACRHPGAGRQRGAMEELRHQLEQGVEVHRGRESECAEAAGRGRAARWARGSRQAGGELVRSTYAQPLQLEGTKSPPARWRSWTRRLCA